MRSAVKIPVIDMIEETALHLKKQGHKRIGLLATTGTIKSRIYENALAKHGIRVAKPTAQEKVMGVIKGIKTGDTSGKQRKVIEREIAAMKDGGTETFVLGCTELPLLFRGKKPDWLVDPMDLLAEKSVEMAGARRRRLP